MFNHVPALWRNGIALVAFAILGWGWWTYTGPYAWLAEAQIALFGAFVPTLTLLFGGLLLMMMPPIFVLGFVYRGRAALGVGQEEWEQRFTGFMARPQVRLAVIGAAAVLFAGWLGFSYLTAGPLTPVDLDTIVRGEAPSYVKVPMEAANVEAAAWTSSGTTTKWYIPLVQEGKPLAVFVTVTSSGEELDEADLVDGEGMIGATGLPGDVALAYEGALAEQTWVVDLEDSPGERATVSGIMAGLRVAALIAAAITHAVRGGR